MSAPRVFLTEPWDPVMVRRGDALGLRALTDVLAEGVAPGLTNRVRDARWVTIIAWCLVRSDAVHRASGGDIPKSVEEQRERYRWLEPLELMWVARTLALEEAEGDRPLPGRRSVKPWYEGKRGQPFGMTQDQYRAYRQTGVYGAYRVVFRKWPGMTLAGDGWRPGPLAHDLARWLEARLGKACLEQPLAGAAADAFLRRSLPRNRLAPDAWWLRAWKNFDLGGRNAEETLPRPRREFRKLPEAGLLSATAFGDDLDGCRRRNVARVMARSAASDHLKVCKELAEIFRDDPRVRLLPAFSRLADAGMKVMEGIADALRGEAQMPLSAVAVRHGMAARCREMHAAARAWERMPKPLSGVSHLESAGDLARAIQSEDPIRALQELLRHHEERGGGLRWFVLRDSEVQVRTPPGGRASLYGFRLWSLARIAVQCGVTSAMPRVALDRDDLEEGEE